MTVAEKIKTMTPEEIAYFFHAVFTTEYFLDNLYCNQCKEKYGKCPVGDGECLSRSSELIKWLMEQNYETVIQRLFKDGFNYTIRLK